MHPADAAKQLQYSVVRRNSDDYEMNHWEAHAYEDVFADVVERGELADVMTVVETLGEEFSEDSRPSVSRAQTVADDILTENGRPLTDGGERPDDE